jgi:hypothetical protein
MACFLRGPWGIHKALLRIHKLAFQTLLFDSGLPVSENASRSKVAHLLPKARTRRVTTMRCEILHNQTDQ